MAKRTYEDVLEVAKREFERANGMITKKFLLRLFPELEEPEERVKRLITECLDRDGRITPDERKECLEWLGNAPEGNPEDNPEHEVIFGIGSWIVSILSGTPYQVAEIANGAYGLKVEGNAHVWYMSIDHVEKNFRLWERKDAACGDVLANDRGYIMLVDECHKDPQSFYIRRLCAVLPSGEFVTDRLKSLSNGLRPATEAERERLMKAMEKAGYMYDTEAHNLVKC